MEETQTKIFLADDHPIFRDGIKALVEEAPNMKVVGEASTGDEILEKLRNCFVQVLLLDIDMPIVSGLEVIDSIIAEFPAIKVLVFSMHSNEGYVHQMLDKGAKGYLLKSCTKAELFRAIDTVSAGDTYLSEMVSKKLLTYLSANKSRKNTDSPLTTREIQVLRHVAKGLTNNQIGKKLSISHRTVDTHRRNIMEKLDLHNAVALTNYAVKKGLIHI